MIVLANKHSCTGCGACRDICPVKAIQLVPDEERFLYPLIDKELCINCGKCDARCPVSSLMKEQRCSRTISAYAAQTKNAEIRENSSSGGIFTEIATYILQNGGIVFGAAFDEAFKVKHIGVEKTDCLAKLRGSKYVQSEIGITYIQAKEYLDAGRLVLFTGTPCQISGLYSFLGHDYENLYTQDIICHGVPSPLFWEQYIAYCEAKATSKLQTVCFRYKKPSWTLYSVQLGFANGSACSHIHTDNLYMRGFLRNLTLRPSCYSCAFKTKHRVSDFTLADFWGIENICPEMDDSKGTSLVILHSEKAHRAFGEIANNIRYKEIDIEDAIKYNSAMIASVSPNTNRAEFFDSLKRKGFAGVLQYIRVPLSQKLRRILKSLVQKNTRR